MPSLTSPALHKPKYCHDTNDTTIAPGNATLDATTTPGDDALDVTTTPGDDALDATTAPGDDALDATTAPGDDVLDATTAPGDDVLDATTAPGDADAVGVELGGLGEARHGDGAGLEIYMYISCWRSRNLFSTTRATIELTNSVQILRYTNVKLSDNVISTVKTRNFCV